MKYHTPRWKTVLASLEIMIIPGIILLGILLHLSQAFIVPAVIFLALLLGAFALWNRANKRADGSEWWQDDDASGWRGDY